MYRFDDNGDTSQIASDTVDLNPPFQMSDLPPGKYIVYADTSTRSEEPALNSQWLGGATSEDEPQTFSVSLDETNTASLAPKPVDPIGVLPSCRCETSPFSSHSHSATPRPAGRPVYQPL